MARRALRPRRCPAPRRPWDATGGRGSVPGGAPWGGADGSPRSVLSAGEGLRLSGGQRGAPAAPRTAEAVQQQGRGRRSLQEKKCSASTGGKRLRSAGHEGVVHGAAARGAGRVSRQCHGAVRTSGSVVRPRICICQPPGRGHRGATAAGRGHPRPAASPRAVPCSAAGEPPTSRERGEMLRSGIKSEPWGLPRAAAAFPQVVRSWIFSLWFTDLGSERVIPLPRGALAAHSHGSGPLGSGAPAEPFPAALSAPGPGSPFPGGDAARCGEGWGGRPRRAPSPGGTPRVVCAVSPSGHAAAPIPAGRGTPVPLCPRAATGARFAAARTSAPPERCHGLPIPSVFFHFTTPPRPTGRLPRSNGPPGRVCPRLEVARVVRAVRPSARTVRAAPGGDGAGRGTPGRSAVPRRRTQRRSASSPSHGGATIGE